MKEGRTRVAEEKETIIEIYNNIAMSCIKNDDNKRNMRKKNKNKKNNCKEKEKKKTTTKENSTRSQVIRQLQTKQLSDKNKIYDNDNKIPQPSEPSKDQNCMHEKKTVTNTQIIDLQCTIFQ